MTKYPFLLPFLLCACLVGHPHLANATPPPQHSLQTPRKAPKAPKNKNSRLAQNVPVAGQSSQNNAKTKKKASRLKPGLLKNLNVSLSVTTFLGTGSFAASSYKNHYIAQSFGIWAAYSFPHRLRLSVFWNSDVEYSLPDNSAGRRFFPRDTFLSFRWKDPYLPLGKIVHITPSVSLVLPTSLNAAVATRILGASLDLGLSRTFGPVTIAYSGSVQRNFHRYTSPLFKQDSTQLTSIFIRQEARNSITLGANEVPIPGSRNTAWTVSNSLALSVSFLKIFSASISFAIFNMFSYPMPDDAYTPQIPTKDGDIKADTTGRSDLTISDISLSVTPISYLSISLGVASFQVPFNNNNRTLRVPFFNFTQANDNYTSLYLRVAGNY